jgi:hypothetical protein
MALEALAKEREMDVGGSPPLLSSLVKARIGGRAYRLNAESSRLVDYRLPEGRSLVCDLVVGRKVGRIVITTPFLAH